MNRIFTAKEISAINFYASAWVSCKETKHRIRLLEISESLPTEIIKEIIPYLKNLTDLNNQDLVNKLSSIEKEIIKQFVIALKGAIICRDNWLKRRSL